MDLQMVSVISAQMKIFLSVVVLDQVDMVDALGSADRSAQSSFHNFKMFPSPSSVDGLDSIAL